MALLFNSLALGKQRAHELAGLNAESANTRKAAFHASTNKSAVAGQNLALPTDIMSWHKQVADESLKGDKKRGAARQPHRGSRNFKAPRTDGNFPRPPRTDQ